MKSIYVGNLPFSATEDQTRDQIGRASCRERV